MSAQPAYESEHVDSVEDSLRAAARRLGEIDAQVHVAMLDAQRPLIALAIAGDDEIRVDAERFRGGEIDMSDTVDPKVLLRKVRESGLVDA